MGFFWFLLFFIFAGGLADSRRQRVRYYRQARPSECPKRTGTTAGQWWRQQRKHRRSSRRCHAGRRRPHLPLSHECFAQRSKANAIRWSKGIFFQFSFLSTRFHIKKQKQKHDNLISIGQHYWLAFYEKYFPLFYLFMFFIGRLDIVLWMWFDRLGDPCRRPLCVLPAAVHAERARVDRHLHSGCHAGDPRVRRPRSHQHLHFGS